MILSYQILPGESTTRASSGKTIQLLADNIPFLVGGSADLAPSNNTYMKSYDDIGKNSFTGKNFRFGVRELGMAGIMSGIQLHGGLRVYGGTFLVFADFLRPAALASLMGVRLFMYLLMIVFVLVKMDQLTGN